MTLKNRYKESIRPKLLKDLGLKNIHQVPKVVKVNVNRGLGEAASNSKALEADTWWQTETGGVMISPLPGVVATKPGSATFLCQESKLKLSIRMEIKLRKMRVAT